MQYILGKQTGFVLTIVLVLAVIFSAQNYLNPVVDGVELCDITLNECTVTINEQPVIVYFVNKPEIEEQLTLVVEHSDNTVVNKVSIQGINMYMGEVPVVEENSTPNAWRGWTFLGACSEPNMHWQIKITIEGSDERGRLMFKTSID